jgi:hypothetical protein
MAESRSWVVESRQDLPRRHDPKKWPVPFGHLSVLTLKLYAMEWLFALVSMRRDIFDVVVLITVSLGRCPVSFE